MLAGWTTALLALALAIGVSRLVVTVPPIGVEVRPAVSELLLVALPALILAGAIGLDGIADQVRAQSFSWLQPASVLLAIAMAVVSLGAAGWWVLGGATGPIDRTSLDSIPPYVRNAMQFLLPGAHPGDRSLRSGGPICRAGRRRQRLGAADRGYTFGGSEAADRQARDLVLRLVAGTADDDIVPQLRELGIGFVWVRDASEGGQGADRQHSGPRHASGTDDDTIWQVGQAVSRSSLVTPGEPPIAVEPPPTTLWPEPTRPARADASYWWERPQIGAGGPS